MQTLKNNIIDAVLDSTDLDTQQVSIPILAQYLDTVLTPSELHNAIAEISQQTPATGILVDGQKPIYHVVMDRQKFGLSDNDARKQDMALEYAIVADRDANAGLIVYAKYGNEWSANPWSTRFLIRILLENCGVTIPVSKSNT